MTWCLGIKDRMEPQSLAQIEVFSAHQSALTFPQLLSSAICAGRSLCSLTWRQHLHTRQSCLWFPFLDVDLDIKLGHGFESRHLSTKFNSGGVKLRPPSPFFSPSVLHFYNGPFSRFLSLFSAWSNSGPPFFFVKDSPQGQPPRTTNRQPPNAHRRQPPTIV